jgi:hypothetical protein
MIGQTLALDRKRGRFEKTAVGLFLSAELSQYNAFS